MDQLLRRASEFADGMFWGGSTGVSAVWGHGDFVHLWVDVPAGDSGLYECTVELVERLLTEMFGVVPEPRSIDHGGSLRETVFEPDPCFTVTVQVKCDFGLGGE